MRKNKTDFQTRYWADHKKRSALQQMEIFFQFNNLAESKERLKTIMSYANTLINEDPAVIYQFHQAMRSFVWTGYFIMLKDKKWKATTQQEKVSP